MKLLNLYERVLIESTEQTLSTIISAVNDRRLINIDYDDDDGDSKGKGWRRIEPFCVGMDLNGNDCLRGWQAHGVSASYPPGKNGSNGGKVDPLTYVPGWRMFRIDRISQINAIGNDKFMTPRPKYNPKDKDMSEVYAYAVFDNNPGTQPDNGEVTPNNPNDPNQPLAPQTDVNDNPVAQTEPTQPQSNSLYGKSGYAKYDSGENKGSKFDKFINKFKNLVGYKTK